MTGKISDKTRYVFCSNDLKIFINGANEGWKHCGFIEKL